MNKIHKGDCLEIIKNIENESIDMIFCDYPFNCQDGRKDYVGFIKDLSVQKLVNKKTPNAISIFHPK